MDLNNEKITRIQTELLKVQAGAGVINKLNENIQPTYDFRNPAFCDIYRKADCGNATSATIYTTQADKDFFLCGAQVSVIKDVTSTSTYSHIRAYIDNFQHNLSQIVCFTLTVQNSVLTTNFNPPLKIDKGTNITIQNSSGVANISSSGCIWGYYA